MTLPLYLANHFLGAPIPMWTILMFVVLVLFFVMTIGPAIILNFLGAKECRGGSIKEMSDNITSLMGLEKVKIMKTHDSRGRFFYLHGFFFAPVIIIDEVFEKDLSSDEKKALILNTVLRFRTMSARSRTLASFVLILISLPVILFKDESRKRVVRHLWVTLYLYFTFPLVFLHRLISRLLTEISGHDRKVSYYQGTSRYLVSALSKMGQVTMPSLILEKYFIISNSVIYYREGASLFDIIHRDDLSRRVRLIEAGDVHG